MNPNVTVIQPTITLEQEQKIRAAAYCRVSSDSTDQLNSFMTQMRYYENFLADSKTETLISVYADEGITGTRMDKREEFQRMLKDCRRGKIDRIIAKSISRFARNTKECLTVLRELKSLGNNAGDLSPEYKRDVYKYTLTVPKDTASGSLKPSHGSAESTEMMLK